MTTLALAWEIFQFVLELIRHLREVSPDDPGKPIRDARESFATYRQAKTPDEKDQALASIVDVLDRL